MMVNVLRVDLRCAVGIGVIAPSDDTGIRDVCWKKVAKPIYFVHCPGLFAMPVETMDSHDTANTSVGVKDLQGNCTDSTVGSVLSTRTLSPYGKTSWVGIVGTTAELLREIR